MFSCNRNWLWIFFVICLIIGISAGQDGMNNVPCEQALEAADENQDGKLEDNEYLDVLRMMSPPGFAEDASTLQELPFSLQGGFIFLACLCTQHGGDSSCCLGDAAHITLEGIDNPSATQKRYFTTVCTTTQRKINDILGIAPTPPTTPTLSPVSPSPTTASPVTASPTTAAPVTAPPTTVSPVTASPTTSSPVTASPTTASPVTAPPTTSSPVTAPPTTASPVTASPTTSSPVTAPPTTSSPVTASPTTVSPVTPSPTTALPTQARTQAPIVIPPTLTPTTLAPITPLPSTLAPSFAPESESPTTGAPITPSPVTLSPTSLAPVTPVPTTTSPLTPAPTTLQPVTPAPVTPSPITPDPTTSSPTQSVPVTLSPTTAAPVTPSPVSPAPVTPSPVSQAPITPSPTTASPITPSPTTAVPVSPAPITPSPTTTAPVTPSPVSLAPVTPSPTTFAPVTPSPVSLAPVTPSPTTTAPVTPSPISLAPVTPSPTTAAPITPAPVTPQPTTLTPTFVPTENPSLLPSEIPSLAPTSGPTGTPTLAPTDKPSESPSIQPTEIPSLTPTNIPTEAPTLAPTGEPTESPTLFPTGIPSSIPTDAPSVAPSIPPTREPTPSPSSSPTVTASSIPSSTPSQTPTSSPTDAPSESPSTSPTLSIQPTSTPSETPSSAPTALLTVDITYNVGFKDGYDQNREEVYVNQLEKSMDILGKELADENFRRRLLRRNLAVTMSSNLMNGFQEGAQPRNEACPEIVLDVYENAECGTIEHSLTIFTDDKDLNATESNFGEAVKERITSRRLHDILTENFPQSSLFVVTGFEPPPTRTRTLSSGETAGISIGVIAVFAGIAFFIYRRRNQGEEDKEEEAVPITPRYLDEDPAADIMPAANQDEIRSIGSRSSDRKRKRISQQASDALSQEAEDRLQGSPGAESSSNAGSSGWSSSSGVSSLNDSMSIGKDGLPLTPTKGIGLQGKTGDLPREDLDSAIQSRNWAAVGEKAALLAAASDSQSDVDRTKNFDSGTSEVDRVAELDQLVDAGDWEGLVVAAAKLESEERSIGEGSKGSGSRSPGSDTPSKAERRDDIRNRVEELVRRVVPEELDNVDEMMIQFKGREEDLIETLRTMEERQKAQALRAQKQKKQSSESTDQEESSYEQSSQFTSQEQTSQTLSNEEGARTMDIDTPVTSGTGTPILGSPPPTPDISVTAARGIGLGVAAAAGIAEAVGIGADNDDSSSTGSSDSFSETSSSESGSQGGFAYHTNMQSLLGSDDSGTETSSDSEDSGSSSRKRKTALEMAIDRGDWEAVGEAAAMMSDASVTTDESSEEEQSVPKEPSSTTPAGQSTYKVKTERASELDKMINEGNWTGIVAAASRLGSGSPDKVSPVASDDSEEFAAGTPRKMTKEERERKKRIKEEQDALAQAEMWSAIAEQNKAEGSTAERDAAGDWALSRSLSFLKKAEIEGKLDKQSDKSSSPEKDSP